MAKIFVHYSKTKAEFIAAGLPATYNNSIVFIKGDTNGNGSCIYTHGVYFANFAEFIATYVSTMNYVKGVTVNGTSYNAAQGGGYVAFNAADPATVAITTDNKGINIGLTTEFINKVNNTADNLGSKTDAANKDGSAFARIANLAALVSDLTGGSTDSIEGQISTAIENLRDEIVGTLDTTDAETLAAINDELDALDEKVKDIADDYLKSSDKTEILTTLKGTSSDTKDSETIAGAKKYADSLNTELDKRVEANEEAIGILNGNDTVNGSVDKKIKDAINDFATKVSDDQTINTFKELIDYASEHGPEFSELVGEVEANTSAIETLNGDSSTVGSVDKKIADAKKTIDDYTVNGKKISTNPEINADDIIYTETETVKAKLDKSYEKPTTGIPLADLEQTIQGTLTNAVTSAETDNDTTKVYGSVFSIDNHKIGLKIESELTGSAKVLASSLAIKNYVDSLLEWEEL